MRGFITEEVYIAEFWLAESSGLLATSSGLVSPMVRPTLDAEMLVLRGAALKVFFGKAMMIASTMTRCSNLRLKLGPQFPFNLCTMFVPFGTFIQGFVKSGPNKSERPSDLS